MQPLQPGDPVAVGRYRLGGRLGSGGMGQVYWGRSPSGRPVAIKVVHPHLAGRSDFRRRFAQEVEAARRVGGFHTAPVVDADPDGDPPWLVTAYVAGPSLAAAIKRVGRFDVPTLRVLGAGLAEALEAVHAAGLVHRDLKPANILLAEDGPRVIDFGIARALDGPDAGGITATGASVGTPRFMAPEQFGGEPITGAADVFAWGCVLCHAAGAHPFGDGSPATVVGAILLKPPRLDAVPPPLVPVVAAALEKDPAHRPTPAQLLDALSDGTSSDGWLPPPVRAMLPEHTLPDATRSAVDVGTARTQVIDGGRTHRITPRQPVRAHAYTPPPQPMPAPAPPPRTRRGLLAVALIGAFLALVVIAVIIGASLSSRTPTITATDAPTATSEPTTGPVTASAVDPSTTVDPAAFVGSWQTVPGAAREISLSITSADASAGSFDLAITITGAAECGGSDNLTGKASGSPVDDSMAANWELTCSNGGTGSASFTALYTYDPASGQLHDAQGMQYTKQ
ncbi:serine/threonine-protein kinase [Pseudonocardia sp. CA-107938]|uniref:serine/threonine-protein kinase n=1 Tax=Pseudonocardia sp. CA-107938 TaxID=3240021 RepID=UPI003D92A4BC